MNKNKALKYVIDLVKDEELALETLHPWRVHGLHLMQHALRVEATCKKIIAREGLNLSPEDRECLSLASILHDVGKIKGRDHHGRVSVSMIGDLLDGLNLSQDQVETIKYLIEHHSDKKNRTNHSLLNLFQDADALDEVGIQSVFMCSNWVDQASVFFFKDMESRLANEELAYIRRIDDILYYQASKTILKEREAFVSLVRDQLVDENMGSLSRDEFQKIQAENS